MDDVATLNPRWHDPELLIRDLADLADNCPDHHTAATAARSLAIIAWQRSVIEELKSTVATLEHWTGLRA